MSQVRTLYLVPIFDERKGLLEMTWDANGSPLESPEVRPVVRASFETLYNSYKSALSRSLAEGTSAAMDEAHEALKEYVIGRR